MGEGPVWGFSCRRGNRAMAAFGCRSPKRSLALLPIALVTATVADADEGALWQALAEGGKVVLMRHAPVDRGSAAGSPLVRDPTCAGERNLSEQGQRFAALAGERFRTQRVPVERVMHSPYCRTTDTANLAFVDAQPAGFLSLIEVLGPEDASEQTEKLNDTIGTYEGAGNLVLVTHEPNINAVSFEMVKHLDMLVLEPSGDGDFEELGVIRFSGED